MGSDVTVEYRLGFEIEPGTDNWYWCGDVFYTKDEALKEFEESVRVSNMNWRLREDRIETSIIKERMVQK